MLNPWRDTTLDFCVERWTTSPIDFCRDLKAIGFQYVHLGLQLFGRASLADVTVSGIEEVKCRISKGGDFESLEAFEALILGSRSKYLRIAQYVRCTENRATGDIRLRGFFSRGLTNAASFRSYVVRSETNEGPQRIYRFPYLVDDGNHNAVVFIDLNASPEEIIQSAIRRIRAAIIEERIPAFAISFTMNAAHASRLRLWHDLRVKSVKLIGDRNDENTLDLDGTCLLPPPWAEHFRAANIANWLNRTSR
jgi:hypothetical protein